MKSRRSIAALGAILVVITLGLPAAAGDRSEDYHGARFKLDSSFQLKIRHADAGRMTLEQGWMAESWLTLIGANDADFDLELYPARRRSIGGPIYNRAWSVNQQGRLRLAIENEFPGLTQWAIFLHREWPLGVPTLDIKQVRVRGKIRKSDGFLKMKVTVKGSFLENGVRKGRIKGTYLFEGPRLRPRPRSAGQDHHREDGAIIGGVGDLVAIDHGAAPGQDDTAAARR